MRRSGEVRVVDLDEVAVKAPSRGLLAGRYQLGPVLGVGSSAVVRRARDVRRGISVAVKVFRHRSPSWESSQQSQEIAALTRLHHPGLIALRDGGTDGGFPFVVTELVEGVTLAERIASGPLPVEEVCSVGAQLASALAHVHARGFVHRDVKPTNVIVARNGRPRLADFGIARVVDATVSTTDGRVIGTPAYLAPEQVRGDDVGPPADVYALGLVLVEAVTGRREYNGSMFEAAAARLFRSPAVPTDLPRGLADVLRAMTDRDPHRRPSASEVATLLAGAARRSGGRPTRWAVDRGPVGVGVLLAAAVFGGSVAYGVTTFVEPARPAPVATAVVHASEQGARPSVGVLTPVDDHAASGDRGASTPGATGR